MEDAFKSGLLEDKYCSTDFYDTISCRLKITGHNHLNQIRMRKATELIGKSSKRLECLTAVLIVLTAVLAGDMMLHYFIK